MEKLKMKNLKSYIKEAYAYAKMPKWEVSRTDFQEPDGKYNEFDYVDLGLPSGTMWATCNVGADKPEDHGLLFQFGRVDGYRYGDNNNGFSKHGISTESGDEYWTEDVLQVEDDAARAHMGGKWRMPSVQQLQELIDNTTQHGDIINKTRGVVFTSNKNNNSIFIPLDGFYMKSFIGNGFSDKSKKAYLWSYNVSKNSDDYAVALHLDNYTEKYTYRDLDNCHRTCAFSVRGVFKK